MPIRRSGCWSKVRPRRSDPENLAPHVFRNGIVDCLTCRNTATAYAWRGWPSCSKPSRWIGPGCSASRGRHRVERQGQHRGVLRQYRPRPRPAHRPVHLAASLSLQRTLSDRRGADRRCRTGGTGGADRRRDRRAFPRGGTRNSAASRPCSRWPAGIFRTSGCDFAVFEAGIGGRYDPVRLVGARITCITSVDYEHVELLGHSLELIVSDKSDACASGGTIVVWRELPELAAASDRISSLSRGVDRVRPRPDRDRRRNRRPAGTAFRLSVRR